MEGSSSQLFDDDQKSSGASKFLFNLPSRGHLSSTVVSSNLDAGKGSSSRAAEKDYHSLTVERLRALLKERGLSSKGKKDELIARLKCVNGSSQKSE